MNLSVRETGTWQHTLDIEVPADEVERGLVETALDVQRRVSLPGFRKGRVPLDLVRQQFAEAVEHEFLDSVVHRMTSEALTQARLDPVVPALVRNVRFTPGQPLRFEALVDVRPQIEIKDYRGVPLTRRARRVDDAAVDAMLARLREESAVYVDLERPAERGDFVLLDSVRVDANGRRLPSTRARGLRVQLGAPDVLPDLENGLLGAVEGQERTVDMRYPAEYPNQDLAGRSVRYLVRVRKIQAQKLREPDDTYAREVFRLDTFEELRARVRQNLEGEERLRVQREVEGAMTDELIRRNPVDLPARLVQWMLDRVIREATEGRDLDDALRGELERRYRPGVERSLKREIVLDAAARQEKLEVSDDELAQEIDSQAQSDPRQAARIRARYQSVERRQGLRESLKERKAMAWVIAAANIHDEAVTETPLVVPAAR
ncbi:MAG: trigger factor [Candidatus Eiseniibacteriota bacterium]